MPSLRSIERRVRVLWQVARRTARLSIGVPDYDTYVAHCAAHHPDQPVMSYADFFRSRQDARYTRGSTRCC